MLWRVLAQERAVSVEFDSNIAIRVVESDGAYHRLLQFNTAGYGGRLGYLLSLPFAAHQR